MARTRSEYKILLRNPKGRGLVEDLLGIGGKVMLTHCGPVFFSLYLS
jgi:hypothetical protein